MTAPEREALVKARNAALEEAANIFDIRAESHRQAWDTCASDGHRNATVWRDKMYEAESAAAAIRALKSTTPQTGSQE